MWFDSAITPRVVVSSGATLFGLNLIHAFQYKLFNNNNINTLLYTPKASAELPSADVHTVGVPTDLNLKKPRGSSQHLRTLYGTLYEDEGSSIAT